jgi:hypothetical protein
MPAQHGQSSKLLSNNTRLLAGDLRNRPSINSCKRREGERFEEETFQAYFDRSVGWLELQKSPSTSPDWEEQVMGYYREALTTRKRLLEEMYTAIEESLRR